MNIEARGLAALPATRPISGISFMNGRTLSAYFAADPSSVQARLSRTYAFPTLGGWAFPPTSSVQPLAPKSY
ncbi:hypothetical protein, partial [Pseudomonas aeruginosa]|uniref:hypothetical protein n=1 Tax=Pseudomonas aeruginosa TaxID=287 RepID=UPI003CC6DA95